MPTTLPVLLDASSADASLLGRLAESARGAGRDVAAVLRLADEHDLAFPLPGRGRTRLLWESLATVAAVDLTSARVLEPHLDARAILAEAGIAGSCAAGGDRTRTWGVFAAEAPGTRLEARTGGDGIRLDGRKPWCSLAGSLSHALVTAWCGVQERGLYAVELGAPGVDVEPVAWVARGLRDVPSGPVSFTDVPAVPVGEPGWYLERPGFAWGGIGVAAVWFGGLVGVARRVLQQGRERELDQVGQAQLGAVDAAVVAARQGLAAAAAAVDSGRAEGEVGAVLALRVRQVVARAAETVLTVSDHALGPGPLAFEEEHARRVADLRLYVRQEHAERDQAALGRFLVAADRAGEVVW
ncbi:MAG TPA: acyl-CoA dehydrogenase [Intrasporangium sp.]|uniref:acyl-CoA dehydrogenase n=1 Tax=Intrasporangium sp. TaxID=1925024 RepID=UPI002D7A3077|nr:acyl-CoA dehydrogenase [Intrasporangium sp.]HET7398341.1 acyl-CoA dehydrogenase [Intrasporangium sp.]